jgi:hypothetical protein
MPASVGYPSGKVNLAPKNTLTRATFSVVVGFVHLLVFLFLLCWCALFASMKSDFRC